MLAYETIKQNESIRIYIQKADESLCALGYTEHSFAHVTKVAETAGKILSTLGYDSHVVELVKIAGYLHDIGNQTKCHSHHNTVHKGIKHSKF